MKPFNQWFTVQLHISERKLSLITKSNSTILWFVCLGLGLYNSYHRMSRSPTLSYTSWFILTSVKGDKHNWNISLFKGLSYRDYSNQIIMLDLFPLDLQDFSYSALLRDIVCSKKKHESANTGFTILQLKSVIFHNMRRKDFLSA